MPLILLNGPPGSGKTTFANMLVARGAIRLQLGVRFREFVRGALGFTDREMEEYKDVAPPDMYAPIRSALIAAADAVEQVDPDVWIKDALRSSDDWYCRDNLVVVDAIGKRSQARWVYNFCKRNGIGLVVAYLCRSEIMPRTFSDGREMVDPPAESVGGWANIDNLGDLIGLEAEAERFMNLIREAIASDH